MKAKKALMGAISIAGASLFVIALSTTAASAYMSCNHDGDCWHTEKRVAAPGERFDYHPDDWYFHQHWDADKDHHYRDYHEGRGYYKGGVWVTL